MNAEPSAESSRLAPRHDPRDAHMALSSAEDCDVVRGGCGRGGVWRAALAELCGTALLVLLSCLAGCGPGAAALPLHRALASGFVVTALVQTLDHISGAFFNPTVLLAAVLWGRVVPRNALVLFGAQLLGATVGAGALRLLQPAACDPCVTLPARGLPVYKAVLIECVLGGCLALANCGAWDARTAGRSDSWPIRIGVTVAALSLVAGELTGASMNPARSFGPALWSGTWTHHWIYWAAPLSGSLMSTLAYIAAWRPLPLPLPPPPPLSLRLRLALPRALPRTLPAPPEAGVRGSCGRRTEDA